jgi:glycosyltransferase involved in cell wall biosynthesis
MTLRVIGGDAPEPLLARASASVTFLGRVGALAPHYDRARIVIAPLLFGAGIKGKVMESWAHGVPVVATSIAFEGFPAESRDAIALADSAEDFAEEILHLNRTPETWTRLQEAGRRTLRDSFSQSAVRASVATALENIMEPLPS